MSTQPTPSFLIISPSALGLIDMWFVFQSIQGDNVTKYFPALHEELLAVQLALSEASPPKCLLTPKPGHVFLSSIVAPYLQMPNSLLE